MGETFVYVFYPPFSLYLQSQNLPADGAMVHPVKSAAVTLFTFITFTIENLGSIWDVFWWEP